MTRKQLEKQIYGLQIDALNTEKMDEETCMRDHGVTREYRMETINEEIETCKGILSKMDEQGKDVYQ